MSSLFTLLKSAVADHALVAVEGVYGAGKSSLIRMLTGRLPDFATRIEFIENRSDWADIV
jgi:ABC-type transport system involved in cytochrome c biogenesis ATPase subunit